MNIDINTRSTHLEKIGIDPANIAKNENIAFSIEQLKRFSTLLVEACAKVQTDRSSQRHGYDKYDDGEAIVQHFEVRRNANNRAPG